MKKIIFILAKLTVLMMSLQVYGLEYDPLLIRAQASIFPKIILLDKDISSKSGGDGVVIEVLHTASDVIVANKVKQLIENQYGGKLGNKKMVIKLVDFSLFNATTVATAYFVLKGESDYQSSVASHASENNRLVFSYDYRDFSNNVLMSVLMKEKTYIYLNKSAIHSYGINFQPLFYKIVKVIE